MISPVNSLAGRLMLASVLLLPLFLGVTGLYLDRSQRLGIEAAQSQRMQLLMLTLLAEAEFDGRLELPQQLLEARFNQPDSGLYAQVENNEGARLWASVSTLTLEPEKLKLDAPVLAIGDRHFARGDNLFQLSYKVAWQVQGEAETPLLFTVLETVKPVDAQLAIYRRQLLLWLGGSAALLILCQGVILLWSLRPLRKLAEEISALESGTAQTLDDSYPQEIQAVTNSLNTLLHSEKSRSDRVRNTLSDLAHSLKTPLAVIRSANTADQDFGPLVREQTAQMEEIVSYQLQRAVGSSHKLLQVVLLAPVVERLKSSLQKVYADKLVSIDVAIEPGSEFRGDERDLFELMGILLDNACKYGSGRVEVRACGGGTQPLKLSVEDDGEGIPAQLRDAIVQRGVRGDSRQGGHGIGLAVAVDLAQNYSGTLTLDKSLLGGARVCVEFP
jgi:two-component system, OmpR family, sensor histidine kinase PhoQ